MVKKFRMYWSKKVYGDMGRNQIKIVSEKFINNGNGFNNDDIIIIKNMKVGQKFEESTPIGKGLTIKRIE